MRLKSGLVSASVLLTLAACSPGSGDGYESDSSRSTLTSRQTFVPTATALKLNSVGTSEKASMLSCDSPTTATRLERDNYSVRYSVITRNSNRSDLRSDKQSGSSAEMWLSYSTENTGQTYNVAYQLRNLVLGGRSVSQNDLYAYSMACTLSNGCEQDKKKFSLGDIWTKIDMSGSVPGGNAYQSCSFSVDPDAETIDPEIQQGRIQIGETVYDAVKVTHIRNGKISCGGEVVGNGSSTDTEIVIADELPAFERTYNELSNSERLPDDFTTTNYGCARTKVFSGSEIKFGGKVISGGATEMNSFVVEGELPSAEEYEKALEDKRLRKAQLQSEVQNALDAMNASEADLARAEAAKVDAEAQQRIAIRERDDAQTAYNADPTAENLQILDQKKQAVTSADELVRLRQDAIDSARNVFNADKNIHDNAVLALQAFIDQNPDI